MDNILLTRQSIFNRNLETVAYQVVLRVENLKDPNLLIGEPGLLASVFSLLQASELHQLVGTRPAFFNFLGVMPDFNLNLLLPKKQIVIELSVKDRPLVDVLDMMGMVKEEGYRVAIVDGFDFDKHQRGLKYIDYVKFDMRRGGVHLDQQLEQLKDTHVRSLVEGVSSHNMFTLAHNAGIKYFQGKFLSTPDLVKGKTAGVNRLVLVKLMAELQRSDVGTDELVETLSQDPRLSYKLLLLLNSAAFSLPRKVESMREAIVYLGITQLRQWARMFLLSRIEDKPHELILTTMIRAKMCELVGEHLGYEDPEVFFTVGLFSTLDALLDKEMADVLKDLTLADNLNRALLERNGALGEVLKCVVAYEQADWSNIEHEELASHILRDIYLTSVKWASACSQTLKATAEQ